MYEEYVNATESKLEEARSKEAAAGKTVQRLQNNVDRLSAVNEQYAATINTNGHHIDALKEQLEALQLRFQEKLDSQSRFESISTHSLSQ